MKDTDIQRTLIIGEIAKLPREVQGEVMKELTRIMFACDWSAHTGRRMTIAFKDISYLITADPKYLKQAYQKVVK